MAKYRFQWEHLPPELLRAILAATGSADVQSLRKRWGARPKENLVGIHRELLTEQWLAQDDGARRAIVDGLRERKLGNHRSPPRSASGELAYIRSCNNSKSFREVVLNEFLRLGETTTDQSRGWRLIDTTTEPPQFVPYPHQSEAWDKLDAIGRGRLKGGLLVLPTGAGKTVTAVQWILLNVLSGPKSRPVLWLAHRSELLDQAADTFAKHAATADRTEPLGIRCISSLHGNRAHTMLQPADVVCATDASLGREHRIVEEYFIRHPDAFVVIDEAHHAAARRYQQLIEIARRSRKVEILGLTATPTRTIEGELGLLHRAFPQGIVHSVEPTDLIAEGILSRPVCESVATGLEFDRYLTSSELAHLSRFGELSPTTLQRIADHTGRNVLIANRYLQHCDAYGQTLVFAASVAHCYTLAAELRGRGIAAGYVAYQRDDRRTNEEVLADFKNKDLDVLLTVT